MKEGVKSNDQLENFKIKGFKKEVTFTVGIIFGHLKIFVCRKLTKKQARKEFRPPSAM